MTQKLKLTASVLSLAFLTFFSSCEKDDEGVAKPTISDLEIGIGNSLIGYIGSDLHIEAEVVAEGYLNTITVEIHAEDGSDNEVEAVYDYSDQNLKNTEFHKHVDIPGNFPVGEYHLHLIVTDKEGNSTTVEEDITLEELVDEEAPVITITSAPASGQAFANGETISISGTITDNISLAGMVVALVYESDNIADTDVSGAADTKVIVMLHTHDFGDDPDETDFTASIAVGAEYDNNMTPAVITGDNAWKKGNYYLLVKSTDAKSNWAISDRYPITIN
nr:DUF4625 domain-containing protein [uncultured Carboxylicivirga sp.]